ncbi:MAG: hypothetical protein ACOYVD_12980 [Bacillota bacterium]
MKKIDLKIALTYVGAIVGAGFASGQELIRFFVVFKNYGLIGTIITGIIFSLLGALVIILVNKLSINNYGNLLENIFPGKIHIVIDILIAVSLWIGIGVMLSGSAALINERLDFSVKASFIFTGLLVFICLQFGSKSLLNTNTILVPFLIFLAIGSSALYIFKPVACFSDGYRLQNLIPNWWTASLLYVAYNMVLGIVVLASVKSEGEQVTVWGGLLGGGLLGLMSFIMVKGLLLLPQDLQLAEMPMLVMTNKISPAIGDIYGLGLWVALFTTALANTHSLAVRISNKINISYKLILFSLIASSFCFIPWKFSALVSIIYPIEGYLAIPIIAAVILAVFKK